ncbi:MAG: GtrA family protein [Eubacteriales bacterium]|nr:GtrA family protein [Eubacteriales bacterium]
MVDKIKALLIKYREFIVYFIVGCLTTLVAALARFGFNFLFFGGTAHPSFAQNTVLSIVDWVAGVAFAYPTNRRFVFQSKNPNILAEAGGFVASRLATLGMDWAVTQLLGTVLGVNVYVTWFIKSVLVFVGNYVLSKLFVFKKKPESKEE